MALRIRAPAAKTFPCLADRGTTSALDTLRAEKPVQTGTRPAVVPEILEGKAYAKHHEDVNIDRDLRNEMDWT